MKKDVENFATATVFIIFAAEKNSIKKMKEVFGEKFYTAEEIAGMLGATVRSVRMWIKEGRIGPYVKLEGKAHYISETTLRNYVLGGGNTQPPTDNK